MMSIEMFDCVVQPDLWIDIRRLWEGIIEVHRPALFFERREHGFLVPGGAMKLLD
jgi:hypothetical protein